MNNPKPDKINDKSVSFGKYSIWDRKRESVCENKLLCEHRKWIDLLLFSVNDETGMNTVLLIGDNLLSLIKESQQKTKKLKTRNK